jgi:hypothetical protein
MDTQSAAAHLQRLQMESEMIQIKCAIDGIRKGDLFVFYQDRSGAGQVLFLDNLKNFPFSIESEICCLLNDAIEQYQLTLNQLNK